MKKETIEHIKNILIYSGYEDELKDILFIEDLNFDDMNFDINLDDLEDFNLDLEPIEFEELY